MIPDTIRDTFRCILTSAVKNNASVVFVTGRKGWCNNYFLMQYCESEGYEGCEAIFGCTHKGDPDNYIHTNNALMYERNGTSPYHDNPHVLWLYNDIENNDAVRKHVSNLVRYRYNDFTAENLPIPNNVHIVITTTLSKNEIRKAFSEMGPALDKSTVIDMPNEFTRFIKDMMNAMYDAGNIDTKKE